MLKTLSFLPGCLLLWLSACREPCNLTTEPQMSLYTSRGMPNSYHRITILGSRAARATFDIDQVGTLPISLVSDTTLYVFESDSRRDTVGITYQRKVAYQRPDCGFTVTLENLKVVNRSSLPDSLLYVEARGPSRGLFGYDSGPEYHFFIFY